VTKAWYNVKVFIPDAMGGSTTEFSRYAASEEEAMEMIAADEAEEDEDGTYTRAIPVSAYKSKDQ
jgi:hypothetical protein